MKRLSLLYISLFVLISSVSTAGSFTDNLNGTVTDTISNLMWQQQDDGVVKTWEQTLVYCEGLSLGGYTDWRLPNIKELKSIADMTHYNPASDPKIITKLAAYWSSTTYVSDTASAWVAKFNTGNIYSSSKASTSYVRCVRSGQ